MVGLCLTVGVAFSAPTKSLLGSICALLVIIAYLNICPVICLARWGKSVLPLCSIFLIAVSISRGFICEIAISPIYGNKSFSSMANVRLWFLFDDSPCFWINHSSAMALSVSLAAILRVNFSRRLLCDGSIPFLRSSRALWCAVLASARLMLG